MVGSNRWISKLDQSAGGCIIIHSLTKLNERGEIEGINKMSQGNGMG